MFLFCVTNSGSPISTTRTPHPNRLSDAHSFKVTLRELQSPRIQALHSQARVLLCRIPGAEGDLAADLATIEEAGVDLILCLVREGELGNYGRAAGDADRWRFRWHHCPTPASCEEASAPALRAALEEAISTLKEGRTLLIHCQYGQVRTGCAAAALLVFLGASPQEATKAVESAGSFPFQDGPLALFDCLCESAALP